MFESYSIVQNDLIMIDSQRIIIKNWLFLNPINWTLNNIVVSLKVDTVLEY